MQVILVGRLFIVTNTLEALNTLLNINSIISLECSVSRVLVNCIFEFQSALNRPPYLMLILPS